MAQSSCRRARASVLFSFLYFLLFISSFAFHVFSFLFIYPNCPIVIPSLFIVVVPVDNCALAYDVVLFFPIAPSCLGSLCHGVIYKNCFFSKWSCRISRERQGGSREVRAAPQRLPRRPSGKWIRSKGALFGGSWIGKSPPRLNF